MKSDLTFALENAGWPALLVNDSGVIVRTNASAVNTFGLLSEGNASLSASIWSSENQTSAEVFLAHAERSSAPMIALKFRTKDGNVANFQTYICSITKDGQRFFLFQLFKPGGLLAAASEGQAAPNTPALQKSSPSGPHGGAANKQKLDCAL